MKPQTKLPALCAGLLILFSIQGCSKQELGGVATVSALLIAVPLIPVVEAYHVVNDTDGKREAERELIKEQLDPVYKKRTELIQTRNAKVDAEIMYAQGLIAFFPVLPGSSNFPGLKHQPAITDGTSNQQVITANETLKALQTLMENDKFHDEYGVLKYRSDIYDTFAAARDAYRVEYNQRMSVLSSKQEIYQN